MNSKLIRRHALGLLATASLALVSQAALAWPTKPIQLLVGFPAGGSADVLARAFGEALSRQLGQSVVVVNRDGAGGTIAAGVVAKADDAHTLMFGPAGPLVLQPHIKPSLPYKAADLVGICQTFVNNYALVASPNSKYRSVRDVINDPDAQNASAGVAYGAGGLGTMPHLGAVQFALQSNATMRVIPYRGDPPMALALKSGELQLATISVGMAQTQGFRILGTFAPTRLADAPDAPTMTEQGLPVVAQVFGGLFAPKSLPAEAQKALQGACAEVARSERYLSAAKSSQQDTVYRPSDTFNQALAAEYANLGQVIRKANLKLD
jgi:tripartite-type tricarboxylate transporter receptor subunit TctC